MNHPLNFPRKPLALAVAIATGAVPVIANANAGRVEFAYGQVSIQDADGAQKAVKKGTQVDSGDTITTERGRAQLRFTDGQFVSLAPKTTFNVEDYNYAGTEDGTEKSFFNLFRGGLRTITGAIGKRNRNAYRMKTPVATIGIRRSEYVVTPISGGGYLVGGHGIIANGVPVDKYYEIYPNGDMVEITAAEYATRMDQIVQQTIPVLTPPQQIAAEDDVSQRIEAETGEMGVMAELEFTGVLPNAAVAYAFCMDCPDSGNPIANVEFPVTATVQSDVITDWGSDPAAHEDLALAPESDFDGIVGWSRWIFDPTAPSGEFDEPGMGEDAEFVQGKQSIHIVGATPIADLAMLASMPPHAGNFTLIGNTIPTSGDGVEGIFNSATLAVDFPTQTVSGTASVTFAERYDLAFSTFSPDGTFATGATVMSPTGGCSGSVGCNGFVAGFIAGLLGERGAFAFHINDYYAMPDEDFSGAAAFTQNPPPP